MFVNLTPHDIHIIQDGVVVKTIKKSKTPLRCEVSIVKLYEIDGVPIYHKIFSDIKELPPEKYGVYYIVSVIVAKKYSHRRDFVIVNDVVRDSDGKILGAKSLAIV